MSKSLKIILFSTLLISVVILIESCKHDPVETATPSSEDPGPDTTISGNDTNTVTSNNCDPDTVYFQNEILPIFLSNCAITGCHDAVSATEGIVLDNFQNIFNTGDIRPGNPDGSDVYEVITENDLDKRMPPASSGYSELSQADQDLIEKWINQGALNLECDSSQNAGPIPSFANEVNPIIQANCAITGCHGTTQSPNLNTYTQISAQATRVKARVTSTSNPMPPAGSSQLTNAEIDLIVRWVDGGAPNN